jgi:hypothetical protein
MNIIKPGGEEERGFAHTRASTTGRFAQRITSVAAIGKCRGVREGAFIGGQATFQPIPSVVTTLDGMSPHLTASLE